VGPRLAIAVVCAAVAAAVLVGGGGSPAPQAAGARLSPPLLAFTAQTRSSPDPGVFVLRRNGTVTPLGHGPGRVVSWSPDGRELLVIHPTVDVGGAEALDALNVSTGGLRPLWRATTMEDAAWSPDGRYIAVEWDGRVSILGHDGEVVRALGEQVPDGRAAGMAWSADGSRLAVTYATPGGTGIAIEQPRGVLPRIMSPCGQERPCHDVIRPNWSPGSNALAMIRSHGGRSSLVYVVPAPGARAVRITATPPLVSPQWSADGRQLAIVTRSLTTGPDVLDVLVPDSGNGPANLETSAVFEHITGRLVWNPAG
jgi:Tol biopolymer transport system component